MDACENLKAYLAKAATFDGREVLIDFNSDQPTIVARATTPQPQLIAPAPALPHAPEPTHYPQHEWEPAPEPAGQEYVAVPERAVAAMPAGARFDEAVVCEGAFYANAALKRIGLEPGHKILIYGASGAIGTAMIQLAKSSGAAVTAVVATRHLELVKSLGADHAIDYTSEDFTRNLELQAQVDTYLLLLLFVAFFRKTQRVSRADRRWLRSHLFARQCPEAFRDRNLRARYLETTELASSYTRYLDTLNAVRRVEEIRRFRSLDYSSKKKRVLALPGRENFSRGAKLICEN